MDETYRKDFKKWASYKEILNSKESDGLFAEREIWWCALGINIGSEQDGKNDFFERPVLIVKKINKDRLLVAPITSQIANYQDRITVTVAGKESQVLLSQIRVISNKRLLRKIQRMKTLIFQRIIINLARFILTVTDESETPPESGESRGPEATVNLV
jgi:mRNA interferase MazF